MTAFVLHVLSLLLSAMFLLGVVVTPSPPGDEMIARLRALDDKLAEHSFPRMAPFWADVLARFYASHCRVLVLRVGRRGGKSSMLCRVAVLEALYGDHTIPAGDVGVVAIISVSRDEAAQRLRTIEAILGALKVKYRRVGDSIELEGRPIVFKTYTATVAGVSGFTCICAICDEVAKWRDTDTNANPATEVLASLRPTMATQPNARMFLSSSPFGTLDAHCEAFDRGDVDGLQQVAHAPTWIANPTITEEQTRRLEPDDRIWSREYAAIPQGSALAAFDPDHIARCFRPMPPARDRAARICVMDPSSGKCDAWTYAICSWTWPQPERPFVGEMRDRYIGQGMSVSEWHPTLDVAGNKIPNPNYDPTEAAHPRPLLHVEHVDGFEGKFARALTASDVVDSIGTDLRRFGVEHVHTDQWADFALASMFADRVGVRVSSWPWTAPKKEACARQVRSWMRDGELILVEHPKLRAQLGSYEERVGGSAFKYSGAHGGHDDFVSLLMLLARVELEKQLPASPILRQRAAQASINHKIQSLNGWFEHGDDEYYTRHRRYAGMTNLQRAAAEYERSLPPEERARLRIQRAEEARRRERNGR